MEYFITGSNKICIYYLIVLRASEVWKILVTLNFCFTLSVIRSNAVVIFTLYFPTKVSSYLVQKLVQLYYRNTSFVMPISFLRFTTSLLC